MAASVCIYSQTIFYSKATFYLILYSPRSHFYNTNISFIEDVVNLQIYFNFISKERVPFFRRFFPSCFTETFLLVNFSTIFSNVITGSSLIHPAFTCSKLATETLEQIMKYDQSSWRRSGVFIVNFEHISHLVLVFPLLTLSR